MRQFILVLIIAMTPVSSEAASAEVARFDGAWTVTVACPEAAGAMGFSYQITGAVHQSLFHAERMHAGEPGWLVIDGPIAADGQAKLYAKGQVGAAQFAVGQRPKGTEYGYHVDARFEGDRGSGRRVEGRRCDLDFVRR